MEHYLSHKAIYRAPRWGWCWYLLINAICWGWPWSAPFVSQGLYLLNTKWKLMLVSVKQHNSSYKSNLFVSKCYLQSWCLYLPLSHKAEHQLQVDVDICLISTFCLKILQSIKWRLMFVSPYKHYLFNKAIYRALNDGWCWYLREWHYLSHNPIYRASRAGWCWYLHDQHYLSHKTINKAPKHRLMLVSAW